MVYPISTAKIFNALQPSVPPNPTPVALPSLPILIHSLLSSLPQPTTYPQSPDFTGDTARLNVQIYNAYPAGTTWVVVYPLSLRPTSVRKW